MGKEKEGFVMQEKIQEGQDKDEKGRKEEN